jgi:hypothetical protein
MCHYKQQCSGDTGRNTDALVGRAILWMFAIIGFIDIATGGLLWR